MMYDVHLYVTCMVKVTDVEAESQEQAIEKAEELMWAERLPQMDEPPHEDFTGVKWVGFADEIPSALVDEHGDEEHERSRHHDFRTPSSIERELLEGLPLLKATRRLQKPACGHWDNQTPSGQNKLGPSSGRALARAKTYPGIARAMVSQWGDL